MFQTLVCISQGLGYTFGKRGKNFSAKTRNNVSEENAETGSCILKAHYIVDVLLPPEENIFTSRCK
jgi:hypothetical protein